MEFTAEWKSLWPISATFSPPLLWNPTKSTKTPLGPLIFTPNSQSTTILQSPYLARHLPQPYPDLTISRFLRGYSSAPYSTLSSFLGTDFTNNDASQFEGFNLVQVLQVANRSLVVLFFPTGENGDKVGVCLVSVKDGILESSNEMVRVVEEGCAGFKRITRLLVNEIDDFGEDGVVGFLMVCTDYSVSWHMVSLSGLGVSLDYLGRLDAKALGADVVVGACWSPHFREECLVLLESGKLLLFDVRGKNDRGGKSIGLVGEKKRSFKLKMRLSLNDKVQLEGIGEASGWFGCEFSWHPRLFIVSCRNAVFLVDSRPLGEGIVSCLMKLETLSMGRGDGFLVLSRASEDGFLFSVATRYLLLLCDVRKPLMPVLRWAHGLQKPRYMAFFNLSSLRANAEDDKYKWASESGSCILLGSFWDNEFSLFCYGPDENGNKTVFSEISKFCNSYFAWGLPSELSLSGVDCNCGSCIMSEDLSRASLPIWVDWRQRKHMVTGFSILNADISAKLFSSYSSGGFALIRLMSSGKVEVQQYLARHELEKISAVGHKRKKSIISEDNLIDDSNISKFDCKKKYQHLKFECLKAYLRDGLAKYIMDKREKRMDNYEYDRSKRRLEPESISNFHQQICQKLKAFGQPRSRSPLTISDVLGDINLPISIQEIALKTNYVDLPVKLLQLAFSAYSDLHHEKHKVPLEFLDVPDQLQIPPFHFRNSSRRGNKWSSKVQPSDQLVGPVLPPHFMTILHKVCAEECKNTRELYAEGSDEFSAHSQFSLQCAKVKEAVEDHNSTTKPTDEHFVSLAADDDDTEDINCGSNKLKFSFHRPSFFNNPGVAKPGFDDDMFLNHVFRSREPGSDVTDDMEAQELFDLGCPVELKFGDSTFNTGSKASEVLRNLKKQELEFQRGFEPYQDYISRESGETKTQEETMKLQKVTTIITQTSYSETLHDIM